MLYIKSWKKFRLLREFVENSNGLIDTKMSEIKDLIDSVSDGQNMIYEWENKDDHQVIISFSNGDISIKYDFDIDDLHLTKSVSDKVEFNISVESIDEGLDIIEKDIQNILGISESHK